MTKSIISKIRAAALGVTVLCAMALPASADQVFADDVIVDGSLCVGQDCVNNESFGFDTIRLKENNTRIKFQDTSNSSSFPTNDWQLTANDSANGGANKFSIDDIDNARTPFTITAGARANSIFVNSAGRVGFGTGTPSVDLHVRQGNTPTLRLEQDGSSGFAAQTWDVAGNETNFFVRDVTNGSKLPFRIRPNAPGNSIYMENNGNVGMGTASPSTALHLRRTDGTGQILVEEADATTANRTLLQLINNGRPRIQMNDTSSGGDWSISAGPTMVIQDRTTSTNVFTLSPAGDVTLTGSIITAAGGTCAAGCDRVFDADYPLPSISEQKEMMFADRHLPNVGPTDEDGPFNISLKIGGMLNELEKAHIYIAQLEERLSALETARD